MIYFIRKEFTTRKTARGPVSPAGWYFFQKVLALDVGHQPESGVLVGFPVRQYGEHKFD